jgi:hypothetical protein
MELFLSVMIGARILRNFKGILIFLMTLFSGDFSLFHQMLLLSGQEGHGLVLGIVMRSFDFFDFTLAFLSSILKVESDWELEIELDSRALMSSIEGVE